METQQCDAMKTMADGSTPQEGSVRRLWSIKNGFRGLLRSGLSNNAEPDLSEGSQGSAGEHLDEVSKSYAVGDLPRFHLRHLSGWAMKFSPTIGAGWQSRYLCLLEKDFVLAYWRTQPEFADEQPSGSINLLALYGVCASGATSIILQSFGRDYLLMFATPSLKDIWYDSILLVWSVGRKKGLISREKDKHHFSARLEESAFQNTGFSVPFADWFKRRNAVASRLQSSLIGPDCYDLEAKIRFLQALRLYDFFVALWPRLKPNTKSEYERIVPPWVYIPTLRQVGSSFASAANFDQNNDEAQRPTHIESGDQSLPPQSKVSGTLAGTVPTPIFCDSGTGEPTSVSRPEVRIGSELSFKKASFDPENSSLTSIPTSSSCHNESVTEELSVASSYSLPSLRLAASIQQLPHQEIPLHTNFEQIPGSDKNDINVKVCCHKFRSGGGDSSCINNSSGKRCEERQVSPKVELDSVRNCDDDSEEYKPLSSSSHSGVMDGVDGPSSPSRELFNSTPPAFQTSLAMNNKSHRPQLLRSPPYCLQLKRRTRFAQRAHSIDAELLRVLDLRASHHKYSRPQVITCSSNPSDEVSAVSQWRVRDQELRQRWSKDRASLALTTALTSVLPSLSSVGTFVNSDQTQQATTMPDGLKSGERTSTSLLDYIWGDEHITGGKFGTSLGSCPNTLKKRVKFEVERVCAPLIGLGEAGVRSAYYSAPALHHQRSQFSSLGTPSTASTVIVHRNSTKANTRQGNESVTNSRVGATAAVESSKTSSTARSESPMRIQEGALKDHATMGYGETERRQAEVETTDPHLRDCQPSQLSLDGGGVNEEDESIEPRRHSLPNRLSELLQTTPLGLGQGGLGQVGCGVHSSLGNLASQHEREVADRQQILCELGALRNLHSSVFNSVQGGSQRSAFARHLYRNSAARNKREQFLNNIMMGVLEVSRSRHSYRPCIGLLISSCEIAAGKCADIRDPSILPSSLIHGVLPEGLKLNHLYMYKTTSRSPLRLNMTANFQLVGWNGQNRESALSDVHAKRAYHSTSKRKDLGHSLAAPSFTLKPWSSLDLIQCSNLEQVQESPEGFIWKCKDNESGAQWHFRCKTKRDAATWRYCAIASKLSAQSDCERGKVLRAAHQASCK